MPPKFRDWRPGLILGLLRWERQRYNTVGRLGAAVQWRARTRGSQAYVRSHHDGSAHWRVEHRRTLVGEGITPTWETAMVEAGAVVRITLGTV